MVFGSCAKEESAPAGPTIEELLVSTFWKLQKIQIRIPPDQGLTDIPNLGLDPCEGDDSFRFSPNNVFTMQDGVYACNGNGKSIFWNVNGGNWKYSAKDSSLLIKGNPFEQRFKVKFISTSSMVMFRLKGIFLARKSGIFII